MIVVPRLHSPFGRISECQASVEILRHCNGVSNVRRSDRRVEIGSAKRVSLTLSPPDANASKKRILGQSRFVIYIGESGVPIAGKQAELRIDFAFYFESQFSHWRWILALHIAVILTKFQGELEVIVHEIVDATADIADLMPPVLKAFVAL